MLRFDLPQVRAHVVRWEAFLTFVVCLVALTVTPWVLPLLTVQGLVRGLLGHHRCPSHRLWTRWFEARGWAGKKEDVGAKMFAAKLLALASAVSFGLWMAGQPIWWVPCVALVVFSFMEWALAFCAGCWVYGAWYRRFPPHMG